eukprot:CAMPEP_0174742942 /NCGR_PEP_ID=MMETSP1094-20130205/80349_1 /TAXON_ID=156173 /ORGANISM="Chrysochromulina brevifilum, Strain UTEX LB 985" /LENGTH=108 /DNA_ID=CAMNT_0015947073 /DNA_START=54 /DNA_END=377 /DNA_ORIENTATION=+
MPHVPQAAPANPSLPSPVPPPDDEPAIRLSFDNLFDSARSSAKSAGSSANPFADAPSEQPSRASASPDSNGLDAAQGATTKKSNNPFEVEVQAEPPKAPKELRRPTPA